MPVFIFGLEMKLTWFTHINGVSVSVFMTYRYTIIIQGAVHCEVTSVSEILLDSISNVEEATQL